MNAVLVVLHLEFLRLICYIAVIASAVQLVEMFLKKASPTLFRTLGICAALSLMLAGILSLAFMGFAGLGG